MTKSLSVLLFAMVALGAGAFVTAEDGPKQPLSEIQQLKAENIKLRAQLLEAQKAVASLRAFMAAGLHETEAKLAQDATAIEADILKALGAKPGDVLDWSTLTIKAAAPPTPKP